jgi:uncharacterized protein (TIGR03437 family)
MGRIVLDERPGGSRWGNSVCEVARPALREGTTENESTVSMDATPAVPDGKLVGDPSPGLAFCKAKPRDAIALFATGLAASPDGTTVSPAPANGVRVTIGNVAVAADFAGLVAVGEFQINFKVPEQFASLAEGNYPVTISINSDPPGPLVLPIQH